MSYRRSKATTERIRRKLATMRAGRDRARMASPALTGAYARTPKGVRLNRQLGADVEDAINSARKN